MFEILEFETVGNLLPNGMLLLQSKDPSKRIMLQADPALLNPTKNYIVKIYIEGINKTDKEDKDGNIQSESH
jgi:hypothetical protein